MLTTSTQRQNRTSKGRERQWNDQKWKTHVQSMLNLCFSLSNTQICDVLGSWLLKLSTNNVTTTTYNLSFRFLLLHYFVDRPSQPLDLFLDLLNSKQNQNKKKIVLASMVKISAGHLSNTLIKWIERKVFESSNFYILFIQILWITESSCHLRLRWNLLSLPLFAEQNFLDISFTFYVVRRK